jgi:hypothetical protein
VEAGIAATAAVYDCLAEVGAWAVSPSTRRVFSAGSSIGQDAFGHDWAVVVSFNIRGFAQAKLAAIVSDEYGIGVRDWSFCAHPLVDQLIVRSA